MKRTKRNIVYFLIGGLVLALALFSYVNKSIPEVTAPYIYRDYGEIPETQAALILGSRVYQNGEMSDVLKDRVFSALELYNQGKVEKLLISGDHGQSTYDEVNTVKEYLLEQGIEPADIFLDHAGFDTYDSLYRAQAIFQIKNLTVVTQEFHLPRAVYIGNSLGIETYGYIADRQPYLAAKWNSQRESLARVKAFFNVILHSKPTFLGDSIPITGNGTESWD